MLLFLFGLPGVGKNYVGELLAAHAGYYFWDADLALLPAMLLSIKNKKTFTQIMRDQFTQAIIKNVRTLTKKHENLVVSQALFKEKNRREIANAFPEAIFFLIQASLEKVTLRLHKRNNAVDPTYTEKIQREFEEPLLPHQTIINEADQAAILKQIHFFQP